MGPVWYSSIPPPAPLFMHFSPEKGTDWQKRGILKSLEAIFSSFFFFWTQSHLCDNEMNATYKTQMILAYLLNSSLHLETLWGVVVLS